MTRSIGGRFALAAALVALTALLAAAVESTLVQGLDSAIRAALVSASGVATALWVGSSWPGAGPVLTVAALGTAVGLWLAGARMGALFALLGLAGGYGVMSMVKTLAARARPPIADAVWTDSLDPYRLAAWDPGSSGFPSGHALLALVVYGYLATVLPPRVRSVAIPGFLLVVFCVGASRVAIGAHWPSDVVGSWLLGAGWLLVVLMVKSAVGPVRQPGAGSRGAASSADDPR